MLRQMQCLPLDVQHSSEHCLQQTTPNWLRLGFPD
jgi:hypothetical protein